MSKESGVFVKLQVSDGSASPTNFQDVAGQQTTEFVGDTETADVTDKSHGGWSSTLNVLRGGTINCQGVADWPDTEGLEVIRDAWENGNDVEAKIIFNSTGKHYKGFLQVTQFNISGAHNGATSYNIALRNNGVLIHAAS